MEAFRRRRGLEGDDGIEGILGERVRCCQDADNTNQQPFMLSRVGCPKQFVLRCPPVTFWWSTLTMEAERLHDVPLLAFTRPST